jgi:polysaccharide biosynthesis/export protein
VILTRLGVLTMFLIYAASTSVHGKTLQNNSAIQVVDSSALPAPDRTDLTTEDRPYLIGAFDKLTIDVFGIDDLSRKEVQADASGRISFPLAGVIEAAGKTGLVTVV